MPSKEKIKIFFLNSSRYLLHVLLPKTCAHCREDLHYLDEGPLCAACRASLEPITGLCCRRCGLPLKSGGERCFSCRAPGSGGSAIDLARSAFAFNPALRSLIHAFKYRGRMSLAEPLGLDMVRAYDLRPELKAYNFALAVPLFKDRERERGFNQSRLLAGVLARERNLFLLEGAAERIRKTPPQAGLSRTERHKNMKGAFKVTAPELVKGRRILIIDDVSTTLSTAEELAGTLAAAGAAGTAVFTLAREPVRGKD
jgi:ComF family protein